MHPDQIRRRRGRETGRAPACTDRRSHVPPTKFGRDHGLDEYVSTPSRNREQASGRSGTTSGYCPNTRVPREIRQVGTAKSGFAGAALNARRGPFRLSFQFLGLAAVLSRFGQDEHQRRYRVRPPGRLTVAGQGTRSLVGTTGLEGLVPKHRSTITWRPLDALDEGEEPQAPVD